MITYSNIDIIRNYYDLHRASYFIIRLEVFILAIIENWKQQLLQVGLKSTKQRNEILNFIFINNDNHPTAYQIYEYILSINNSASLGNIYHNLTLLENNNLIRKIGNGDPNAPSRFETVNDRSHLHIVCVSCGKIQNIHNYNINSEMKDAIFEETNFKLLDNRSNLFGICSTCFEQ